MAVTGPRERVDGKQVQYRVVRQAARDAIR